jgi:hypothetical protein
MSKNKNYCIVFFIFNSVTVVLFFIYFLYFKYQFNNIAKLSQSQLKDDKKLFDEFETTSYSLSNDKKSKLIKLKTLENIHSQLKDEKIRNSEWEQINKYTFFRRNSAFYFIDTKMIRIFYFTKKEYKRFTYSVELLIYNNVKNKLVSTLYLNNNSYTLHDERHLYKLLSLNIEDVNLSKHNIDDINLKLIIIDENNKNKRLKTKYPIDIIKTFWIGKNKSGSMVCSTSYFYYYGQILDHKNPYFLRQFQWWFELNRRVGHKKIQIYNTSIPNTHEYNDLFDKYKDYVEIKDLKYFPNYFYTNKNDYKDDEHDYLNSFSKIDVSDYAVFQTLVLNDCYLSNKHLYNYISVIDQDEIIMPRVNEKIRKNMDTYDLIQSLNLENIKDKKSLNSKLNLESSCSVSNYENKDMDLYLDRLKNEYKINNDNSFHFSMSYYLSYESIEIIFNKFEEYFGKENYQIRNGSIVMILLNDPTYNNYTYHFIFRNQNDVNYVKNLLKIYKIMIRDFFISNRNILNKYSIHYNRYFYLNGDISYHMMGKAIHSTNSTWQLTTHYSTKGDYYSLNNNDGVNSHFRVEYSFLINQKIEIKDLILDLNYLYCYYRNVLKHFTSLDIITD